MAGEILLKTLLKGLAFTTKYLTPQTEETPKYWKATLHTSDDEADPVFSPVCFEASKHRFVRDVALDVAARLVESTGSSISELRLALFVIQRAPHVNPRSKPTRQECNSAVRGVPVDLIAQLSGHVDREAVLPNGAWLVLKILSPPLVPPNGEICDRSAASSFSLRSPKCTWAVFN